MLVTCNECGKQISDRAQSCPHCGNPMAEDPMIEYTQYRLNHMRIGLFIMMLVGLALIGFDFFRLVFANHDRQGYLASGIITLVGTGFGYLALQAKQKKLDTLKLKK